MKIYIASSWKNVNMVRAIAAELRKQGFDVDDFTDDSRGKYTFNFSEIPGVEQLNAIDVLGNARVQRAFQEDKKMIDWADAVLLVLPAGKSSHLEAGYAKGSGKKLVIWSVWFPPGEFDVMYGFADLITDQFNDVIGFLSEANEGRE